MKLFFTLFAVMLLASCDKIPLKEFMIAEKQTATQVGTSVVKTVHLKAITYEFTLKSNVTESQDEPFMFASKFAKKFNYEEIKLQEEQVEEYLGKYIDFSYKASGALYSGRLLVSPIHYLSPPLQPWTVRADNRFRLTTYDNSDLAGIITGQIKLSEVWEQSFGYPNPPNPAYTDMVAYNVEQGQVILLKVSGKNKLANEAKIMAIYVRDLRLNEIDLFVIEQTTDYIVTN